jgi:hypothetical protein
VQDNWKNRPTVGRMTSRNAQNQGIGPASSVSFQFAIAGWYSSPLKNWIE